MSNQFTKTNYKLQSLKTGKIFDDTGWTLDAPGETEPSLIRAVYEKKLLTVGPESMGIYRFADWLPVGRILKGSSSPVTYKSEGLAKKLGLENLWITFSGYCNEKGANFKTCSFKETEAYSVCGRMTPEMNKVLVVASAGNTARAFAQVCSDNQIPLLICVPEDNLNAMWFDSPLNDCVKLICSQSGSDYFDAIHLSNIVAGMEGFIAEGGAKNVARRDGMGTTMLSATTTIGQIPDYYFQAIGSGTGAIAAWEANLRLLEDGRFGKTKMKLMVSQNIPFVPIYDAWKAKSRAMLPLDDALARKQVEEINAKVLSNRKPPYPIFGGLFDAMNDTGGDVLLATNKQAAEAATLFEITEGIDIHPAPAVATATLIEAAKNGIVKKDDLIMLNITGGGENKFKLNRELFYLKPQIIFDINTDTEEIQKRVALLFSKKYHQYYNMQQLRADVEQRDFKIAEMDVQIVQLQTDIASKDDSIETKSQIIAEKLQTIVEKENEMNTAFFVSGTYDQLVDKGVLTKEGGFLGIAKNVTIRDDVKESNFTRLDIRNASQFPLNTRKAKLVSEHPDNSYRLVEQNDKIAYLEIENPREFWKLTKYVIVETK